MARGQLFSKAGHRVKCQPTASQLPTDRQQKMVMVLDRPIIEHLQYDGFSIGAKCPECRQRHKTWNTIKPCIIKRLKAENLIPASITDIDI